MPRVRSIALLAALGGVGCAPPASRGGFDNPSPGAKMYAIEDAIRRDDRSPETTRHIVEQLDSEDPAVRLLAISALQHLWNTDYGYHYDDPIWARDEAIQVWVRAVDEGWVGGPAPATPPGRHDG